MKDIDAYVDLCHGLTFTFRHVSVSFKEHECFVTGIYTLYNSNHHYTNSHYYSDHY